MPLATYIFLAMTAFVPVAQHTSFEPAAVTRARYSDIAADIAQAAEELPVVDGDAAKTALVLASIASYESQYSARVDDCRARGGSRQEPAYTLFQLAGRRDLCASRLEAARAALGIVEASLACPWGDRLALYALGRCGRSDKARWRWNRAHDAWSRDVFGLGGGA